MIAAMVVNATLIIVAATKKHSGVSTMRFCVSKWSTLLTAAVVASSITGAAQAATVNNTSLVAPGVYYGSGNVGTNANWTVSTDNNVELGVRAIHRAVGPVAPTGNVYNVPTGNNFPDGTSGTTRAWWNFDYSVNLRANGTGTLTLADVTPTITVLNQANGQSISFNPFVPVTGTPDNAGWNGALTHEDSNSAAFFAGYGFQNSENLTFGFVAANNPLFGFDFNLDDTFTITLSLLGPGNASLGSVQEIVIVGAGAQTPLPAALPLFATGLGALGFVARRRKRKASATA